MSMTYVIACDVLVDGEQLYWSNTDGWGSQETADTFTSDERLRLNLPLEGTWHEVEEDDWHYRYKLDLGAGQGW
jgi:hypothetical protein